MARGGLVLLLLVGALGPRPVLSLPGRPPHWTHLAMSGNGATLLAAAYEDGVYLSQDAARTFSRAAIPYNCTLCQPSRSTTDDNCKFAAVAASADGRLLFAAAVYDGVYRSIDAGATWAKTNAPSLFWQQSMAASSSGQYVYALTPTCPGGSPGARDRLNNVCSTYGIWRSEDNGALWGRATADALNWRAVAASGDGSVVVAAAAGSGIFRSTNFGRNFSRTAAPNANWHSLAVSGDGARVVAVAYGDINVRLSADGGSTWTSKSVFITNAAPWQPWIAGYFQSWHNWAGAAASAAGDRLGLVSGYGFVYTSKNNGSSFELNSAATPAETNSTTGQPVARTAGWEFWTAVAMSSDGKIVLAAEVVDNGLYMSTNYGTGAWTKLAVPDAVC